MSQFKKPQMKLNLGDLDATKRLTSTTTTTTAKDSPIEESRTAAVKRYQGYLHDSMKCSSARVFANAGYRSINIARGHQSPPSSRVKRLLNTLPRLNTELSQQAEEPPARPAVSIAPSHVDVARLHRPCAVVGYFDYEIVLRNEMQLVLAAADRYITVTDWTRAYLAHQPAAERAAREEREALFYRSLMSEAMVLDRCKATMQASEPVFVGLVPAYDGWQDRWRYRTATEAIECARAERREREEWAVQFPDTRFLTMQGS